MSASVKQFFLFAIMILLSETTDKQSPAADLDELEARLAKLEAEVGKVATDEVYRLNLTYNRLKHYYEQKALLTKGEPYFLFDDDVTTCVTFSKPTSLG